MFNLIGIHIKLNLMPHLFLEILWDKNSFHILNWVWWPIHLGGCFKKTATSSRPASATQWVPDQLPRNKKITKQWEGLFPHLKMLGKKNQSKSINYTCNSSFSGISVKHICSLHSSILCGHFYTTRALPGAVSCNRDCMTSCPINKVCRPCICWASAGHKLLRKLTAPHRDKSTPWKTKLS